jgi:uncharacterized protein (DUF488 family)
LISTIGYEGAKLEDFVATLNHVDIDILVDIRERAQSRRKGFSKTALSEALASAGIDYLHLRELGDPKPGREAARRGDWEEFRSIFSEVVSSTTAQDAIRKIEEIARESRVCLLCYERDYTTCHRKIVSDILDDRLGSRTQHLGVRTIESLGKSGRRVLHPRQSAAA